MTEMTIRDCDSLKNIVAASLQRGRRARCPQGDGYNRCRSEQPFGIETGFGECYGKSSFGAIVRALHQTFADQFANSVLHFDLVCEIDVRRWTDF